MADIQFMRKKFSVELLISNYLEEIKKLRVGVKSPADETKLQQYYQAANTFKRVGVKDWVQFALSRGNGDSGMTPQIRSAFPTVLGNRVSQLSAIDLAYAQLLIEYAVAFKKYKGNLKDFLLRFVLNSRFSPLRGYVDQEISRVIANTKQKINSYS